ncbi:MAG: hypothetical protein DRN15_10180 [Thermoprotei archaeon]|nr:MAG: hypothetical protein DRN15_10180 [Thermoprotei archaeon]RLF24851.1 MAG: hypothetical protein DRM97_02865 [Thermoprotei archaeon]
MPRRQLNTKILKIVGELRKMNYGYRRIQRYLQEHYGLEVPRSTIHYWVRKILKDAKWIKKTPIEWSPRKCSELAYLIGVTLEMRV